MNEAYIFFTVIYSVVALAILALFARDLVKWLKRRRTKRALDGATGAAKEQARRNEFLRKHFPSIYPPRK